MQMQRTECDEFDPDRFQARADASCLSKLLIISNESPVLNSFSPFSLLPPFLFLILFFLSAFSSFFFIPFVVPIESNFTVQQDRYVRLPISSVATF